MFNSIRKIIGSTALTLGLMSLAAVPAAVPGENGRIAFMRQDDQGFWQVLVSNPDLGLQAKPRPMSRMRAFSRAGPRAQRPRARSWR
jgi:hypothetical protein